MTTKTAREVEHGPCRDCGLMYARGYAPDERYHRKVHDEALYGRRAELPDGFYAITHESRIALQKLAQSAASAARRETEYDFPSFAAVKKKHDKYKTIAMICVQGGRVCGLLVSRERECQYSASLNSFQRDQLDGWRPTEIKEVESRNRRAIDMIWVLKESRRQGVAKGLADALANHCGLLLEDFAHMLPFREEAVNLWKALELSTIYVV